MFSHIPEEIFCPQVSGNIHDALRVLKVKVEGPKNNAHFFDLELSLVDPENPVTQISKTPSDEEFPWCGEDTDADVLSAAYDQEQLSKQLPMEEVVVVETRNEETNREEAVNEMPEQDKKENDSPDKKENDSPDKKENDSPDKKENYTLLTEYRNLAFPERPRSMIKSELLVKDVKKFIDDMKKQTAPDDLEVRIIPSNLSCRFDLPIDLTRLKGECPLSYLRKYCRVTDSRRTVYKEKFDFYSSEQPITVSVLGPIYERVFGEELREEPLLHLRRLLDLELSLELDSDTFIAASCLMERILIRRGTAQGHKKNIFEVTNFSALNGKLRGIDLSPKMMELLEYIREN